MYKNTLSLLLSALFILGCDSQPMDKSSKAEEKKSSESAPLTISDRPVTVGQDNAKQDKPPEKVESVTSEKMSKEKMPEEKPVTVSMSGEQVYKSTCQNCHASGAAGSPKLDDVANWTPRIAKGMEALYQSAIKGIPASAMMPKGTCTKCTDDELRAAVDFMVSSVKNN